jgi:fumarate reductase flavoprotein subunit
MQPLRVNEENMSKWLFLMTLLVIGVSYAAGTDQKISGKHLENDLQCADCHGTEDPTVAAKYDACIDCHGDMMDRGEVTLIDDKGKEVEYYLHDPHELPPNLCIDCHSSHKATRLYCNQCHKFTNKVP